MPIEGSFSIYISAQTFEVEFQFSFKLTEIWLNCAMQFNRGTSAMQHYVATRPMFIDLEVMSADSRLVLGDHSSQVTPSNVARGLSSLYKEITGLGCFLISLQEVKFC